MSLLIIWLKLSITHSVNKEMSDIHKNNEMVQPLYFSGVVYMHFGLLHSLA